MSLRVQFNYPCVDFPRVWICRHHFLNDSCFQQAVLHTCKETNGLLLIQMLTCDLSMVSEVCIYPRSSTTMSHSIATLLLKCFDFCGVSWGDMRDVHLWHQWHKTGWVRGLTGAWAIQRQPHSPAWVMVSKLLPEAAAQPTGGSVDSLLSSATVGCFKTWARSDLSLLELLFLPSFLSFLS